MAADFSSATRNTGMSDSQGPQYNDGINDAIAATAVIAIVVATVVFWLSGMPT